MAGFLLNDYADANKDWVNKPWRAIPSGKLSPAMVLGSAFAFAGATVITALLAMRSPSELLLYALLLTSVVLYNWVVRHAPALKTFYTAAACALPVLHVLLAGTFEKPYFSLILSPFLFVTGRELLMDTTDLPGDRANGTRTLPMILGPVVTASLAFALQLTALGYILLALSSRLRLEDIAFISFASVFVLLSALAWWKLRASRNILIRLQWAPMIAGLLILLGK